MEFENEFLRRLEPKIKEELSNVGILHAAGQTSNRGDFHFGTQDLGFYLDRDNVRDSQINIGHSIKKNLGPLGNFIPDRVTIQDIKDFTSPDPKIEIPGIGEIDSFGISKGLALEDAKVKGKPHEIFNEIAVQSFGELEENPYTDPNHLRFFLKEVGGEELVWGFICAPEEIPEELEQSLQVVKTPTTTGRSVIYGGKSMKTISISDVLVEGLVSKTDLIFHLENLRKFCNEKVFELFNASKDSERAYGFFMIQNMGINEILRTKEGNPLRARISIKLQEIPEWQIEKNEDSGERRVEIDGIEEEEDPFTTNSDLSISEGGTTFESETF